MGPFNYHRLAILCCCVLLYTGLGCEEQAEAPPPQPKVVAKKIAAAPAPAEQESAPAAGAVDTGTSRRCGNPRRRGANACSR
jgi:hypothetical protein